ncbi:leucine-rich repeat domain-containing protein [Endozoicomonas arenosclerae]|uniref:leucine-rich repeat domain-containing protein n=1 Tax=Endozoicomonas arenosclerae TaxID=1633495 RepID=UPI000783BE36|nr:NEL-type E3 ubiquitin ligase domain-containing protein [Endozoicomonas arenosclerae]
MDPKINYSRNVQSQLPRVDSEETTSQKSTPLKDRDAYSTTQSAKSSGKGSRLGRFYLEVIQPKCLNLLKRARESFSESPKIVRLTERAIGVVGGLNPVQQVSLAEWVLSGTDEEQPHRQEAADLIARCVSKGKKTLTLNNLPITSLPDVITEISWLNKLQCEGCQLQSLPEDMGRLSRLKSLDCRNNQLTAIPECLCTAEMPKLRGLFLSQNLIQMAPDDMSQLSHLRVLDLYDNKLSELPEGITTLPRVRTLYLGSNQLSSLPGSVGQLKKLETLHLARNQFTDVPDGVIALSNQNDRNCIVHLFGNGFGQDAVFSWRRSHQTDPSVKLLAIRAVTPVTASKMSFEEKIQNWFDVAGLRMPPDFPDQFPDPSVRTALGLHMEKLVETLDYQRGYLSAQTMARKLVNILQQMAEDPEIMSACTAASIEATGSCDDRALLGLNEMDTTARVASISKKGGLSELVELKKSLIRKEKVEALAKQKYQYICKHGDPYLVPDEIEVRLYYMLGLQKSLKLPIEDGQRMRYASYSQVTKDDLKAAVRSVYNSMQSYTNEDLCKDLLAWPEFVDKLKNELEDELETINEKYVDLLTDDEEVKALNSGELTEFGKLMGKQREMELDDFLKTETLKLLNSGNPPGKW